VFILLPADAVNSVQTRKALEQRIDVYLGGVLDDQLKVVGADVTIDSLVRT
jgi:hypothetical protein